MQPSLLLLAAASTAVAQSVSGTAYGFATGVTGGGSATAATPSDADELATWLSDDTARVILIDQEYDFTGTNTTGAGCSRKSCTEAEGGQLYLGDLSCGGTDNVAISSISYDAAGNEALSVGSNKSIISSNGKGVLKGKGLSLKSGAENVIIQGIEFTDINPKYVWGGDALDFQGGNDGVWVDHCKFSLVGRMFVVSHYTASRITLSNNEFDGQTSWSASCNGNHYWTMMFIADGDQVTFDRNYFHDVSGRAPKLGQDGVSGTFQATNNYFSNMEGHAFDAYDGASVLVEGNVFDAVNTPVTEQAATVDTFYNVPDSSAASACSSSIGRTCVVNSVSSDSGDFPSMDSSSALTAFSKVTDYLVEPIEASEVKSAVTGNAGPANLASYSGSSGSSSGSSSSAAASKSTAAASKSSTGAATKSTSKAAAKSTSTAKTSSQAKTTTAASAAAAKTSSSSTSTKTTAASTSKAAVQAAASSSATAKSKCLKKKKRDFRDSLRV